MKLENQVCPRKQGNDLRALGITNALFYWMRNTADEWVVHRPHEPAFPDEYADDWAPAFTVAELGVMLPGQWLAPDYVRATAAECTWCSYYEISNGKFVCMQQDYERNATEIFHGETEAEARAALLIHLLETGLVAAKKVNQRLSNP